MARSRSLVLPERTDGSSRTAEGGTSSISPELTNAARTRSAVVRTRDEGSPLIRSPARGKEPSTTTSIRRSPTMLHTRTPTRILDDDLVGEGAFKLLAPTDTTEP